MNRKRFRMFVPAVIVMTCSFWIPAQTRQPAAPVDISFTVSMSKPHTHLLEVDMLVKRRADVTSPKEELLVMPVWTPGSYLVREFERHVQDFAARDVSG